MAQGGGQYLDQEYRAACLLDNPLGPALRAAIPDQRAPRPITVSMLPATPPNMSTFLVYQLDVQAAC